MRVIFFGTPDFAVPTLNAIAASPHRVAGVVTQPDRPHGRGHKLTPPPVKVAALRLGLPVLQPRRLKSDEDFYAALGAWHADLGVVAAYGRLLPQRLLDLPHDGMVNVHASLMPRWRGAAPIARAILAGDRQTGVTIMRVVLALDAGPILAREPVAIDPDETTGELERRLADIGARLLVETLGRLDAGLVDEQAQDEALVTYAARLERGDSPVDWSRPARAIHDRIRGLQPWPQATTTIGGRRVLLKRSAVAADAPVDAIAGTILSVEGDGLLVAADPGVVRLTEVQPEGRAAMTGRAFFNGQRLTPGDVFASPSDTGT